MLRWSLPSALLMLALLPGVVVWSGGCRPQDPPPPMAKNMGTPDRPLVPTPAPTYDPDILSGRATPVRAEDLGEEVPAEPEPSAETPGSAEPVAGAGGVTAEDQALIAEVVELAIRAVAGRKFEELGDYIAPDQREPALTLVRTGATIVEAGTELGTVIQEKAPNFVEQVQQLQGMFGGQMDLGAMPAGGPGAEVDVEQIVTMLKVTNLRMTSPNKAAGLLGSPPQALPLQFDLIDGEWYLRLPAALLDAELVSGIQSVGDLVVAKMNDLANRLRDGSLTPEQLMPAIMMAVQELQPALAPLAPKLQAVQGEIAAAVGAEVPEDIRPAIEGLVADWDAAEAERRWDDLVTLHAPELAEAARSFFDQYGALLAAIERLAAALDTAQASAGDPVRERLTATLTAQKSLTWMGLVSEGKIAATVSEQDRVEQVEFRLAGEEWHVWRSELADPAISEAVTALLGSTGEQFDALSAQVGDGSVSVEDAVARFATIMGEFEARLARLKAGLVGEEPAEAAEEAPPPTEEEPPPVEEEEPPAEQPPPSRGIGPAIG